MNLVNNTERFKQANPADPAGLSVCNPYERFADADLILRDQLAIDRTILANERTFLAYCRTSLALILTGAGCIKFFDTRLSDIGGIALIALGILVMVVGTWRTIKVARNIGTVSIFGRQE